MRAEALRNLKGGLRALHRTLELPGANPLKDAHAALDAAVLAAYGFSAKKDLLAQLLALNLEVAANIAQGSPVTAPGVPKNYPEPKRLLTTDCVEAPGRVEFLPTRPRRPHLHTRVPHRHKPTATQRTIFQPKRKARRIASKSKTPEAITDLRG